MDVQVLVWGFVEYRSGFCEHGSEHSGCINGRKCLDQLSDCQLLKKYGARCELIMLKDESCFLHTHTHTHTHTICITVIILSDNCLLPLPVGPFNVST